MLNLGGVGNPDVLEVQTPGGVAIVKDYAPRAAPIRRLAPLLVTRELALLERVAGVPGLPRPLGRIDAEAFALERLAGEPLRRRTHRGQLPPSFFAALEAMLEALRDRGVLYADLRSPSNVLCTPDWAPALVDLASASCLPAPRAWIDAFYRLALAKLRSRFAGTCAPTGPVCVEPAARDLRAGRMRIRTLDLGPLGDPVPCVVVPERGDRIESIEPLLTPGVLAGRRAVALELPREVGEPSDPLDAQARWLDRVLERLRLPRIDLVTIGGAASVAQRLASAEVARVRAWIAIGVQSADLDPSGERTPNLALDSVAGHSLSATAPSGFSRELGAKLWNELTAISGRATV